MGVLLQRASCVSGLCCAQSLCTRHPSFGRWQPELAMMRRHASCTCGVCAATLRLYGTAGWQLAALLGGDVAAARCRRLRSIMLVMLVALGATIIGAARR